MFVLRAAFWIPVVALLAPAEPEFGPTPDARAGDDVIASMQTQALEALARVKAEIAEQQQNRAAFAAAPQIAFPAEHALRSD
jgi:hypothetical protein